MVLNNPKNDATYQFSAIDPAPIIDADGNLWVVWGSGYGKDQSKTQIWITRMDNATGLPLATDKAYKPPTVLGYPLKTGRREGAYMHHRDSIYYLFWNEGSCCSGTSSTYTIWVSRSTSITGPFTDSEAESTAHDHETVERRRPAALRALHRQVVPVRGGAAKLRGRPNRLRTVRA